MKKLLMFMSVLMIGSQIRPMSQIDKEALIGAGAYIGTSVLVSSVANWLKPGAEPSPFTPTTFVPSICAAMAGVMAYKGEYKTSCSFGIGTLVTALFAIAYSNAKPEQLIESNNK